MSRALGDVGEARAAELLQKKGLRVVARNFACRGGEIDLVCEDGDTLVFVEVRARKDDRHGAALETVRDLKRRRLVLAAQHYLAARDAWARACRFDVVAIVGDDVVHVEDAFSVDATS